MRRTRRKARVAHTAVPCHWSSIAANRCAGDRLFYPRHRRFRPSVQTVGVTSAYSELLRIVDPATSLNQRAVAMRTFAEVLDWVPSYGITETIASDVTTGHLIVQHGLENAAAITFLKGTTRSIDIGLDYLRTILSISYNNLLEWLLIISSTDARWLNNLVDYRSRPQSDNSIVVAQNTLYNNVSFLGFASTLASRPVSRTIRPCDEALIRVITRWKSLLKAELPSLANRNISALFNAIIFVRGCEDSKRVSDDFISRMLLDQMDTYPDSSVDITAILSSALREIGIDQPLAEYVDVEELIPFRAIDRSTTLSIFKDMYITQDPGYYFNFSLMSKHAMSSNI